LLGRRHSMQVGKKVCTVVRFWFSSVHSFSTATDPLSLTLAFPSDTRGSDPVFLVNKRIPLECQWRRKQRETHTRRIHSHHGENGAKPQNICYTTFIGSLQYNYLIGESVGSAWDGSIVFVVAKYDVLIGLILSDKGYCSKEPAGTLLLAFS
jgi:hypothetical protein